jgi:AcrR family transcriptional regulator
MHTARYHHGNLRTALLDAGVRQAAAAGPMSLQIRELAKTVGVSPSAVYRHFPDLAHICAEVSRLARERLAEAMQLAAERVPAHPDAGVAAVQRFNAIGRAYVEFAATEPRLFDMAFTSFGVQPSAPDDPSAWDVLTGALDAMVTHGELQPALRAEAPWVAWSAVHGLASMVVRGLFPDARSESEALHAVVGGVRRALGLREVD